MSNLLLSSDPQVVHALRGYYRAILAIIALIGLVVLFLLGLVVKLSVDGNQQRHDLQVTSERVESCTDPTGACYKNSQAQTAEVVASLNVVTEYSVICGEKVDGEQNILDCVNAEVKRYLKERDRPAGE